MALRAGAGKWIGEQFPVNLLEEEAAASGRGGLALPE